MEGSGVTRHGDPGGVKGAKLNKGKLALCGSPVTATKTHTEAQAKALQEGMERRKRQVL